MNIEIRTELYNYYGRVCFAERDGAYYMQLEDWGSDKEITISKEFFDAALKEFSNEQSDI